MRLLSFGLYLLAIIPTTYAQIQVPLPPIEKGEVNVVDFVDNANNSISLVQPRIVGGTEVNPAGKYPFMTIIYKLQVSLLQHI